MGFFTKEKFKLIAAVQSGDLKKVANLLEKEETDVNEMSVSSSGLSTTPLIEATVTQSSEILLLLIKSGADVNIKNNHGWRAIDIARYHKNQEIIQILETGKYIENY